MLEAPNSPFREHAILACIFDDETPPWRRLEIAMDQNTVMRKWREDLEAYEARKEEDRRFGQPHYGH